MPGYFPQLLVVNIDAYGFPHPLPDDLVNVYNVTAAAPVGVLSTDSDGVIAEDSMSGSAGDVIEFSHATYLLTIRLTLQGSQEEAYTAVENDITTYVVENLFTDTTDATSADIYIVDPSEPGARRRIGSGKADETVAIPYESSIAKTMRVFTVAKADSFVKTEKAFDDDKGVNVYIPATESANPLLFDHYTDATTTGTGKQTLYSDTIDAGTWADNGDLVECEYSGFFAANNNNKDIVLSVAGQEIASIGVTENDTKWSIEAEVMRQSNALLRTTATLSYGDPGAVSVVNVDVGSLDLAATDYDILLRATTASGAGDLTATMGNGKFWKGTGPRILTIEDFDLTIDGYTVTIG